MILQRTWDVYTGMYDFATSGGAIGSLDLQVPIYANSVILSYGFLMKIGPASATTSAKISFDLVNNSVAPVVTAVGFFLPPTGISGLPAALVLYGAPLPVQVTDPFSIGMSISVEALTAGQIQFWFECVSYDF